MTLDAVGKEEALPWKAHLCPDLPSQWSRPTEATQTKDAALLGARARKAPNQVWCIDFKGQFAVGTTRCHPLTITDAFSRYLIACVALNRPDGQGVRKVMQQVFDEFGLPDAIRSDNGAPFASTGLAGLSQVSAWW